MRNAIQWVSEERQKPSAKPVAQLVDAACLRFDLTPEESEFLLRFFTTQDNG